MAKRDNSIALLTSHVGFEVKRLSDMKDLVCVSRACSSRAKDNTAFSVVLVGNNAGRIEITGTTRTLTVLVVDGNVKVEHKTKGPNGKRRKA